MRKAKPKKKLEVKVNEVKPVPVVKVLDPTMHEKLGKAVVFCTLLTGLEANMAKHRELWKESYAEGGFLKMPYKIKMGRIVNLCKEIRGVYAERGIEDSPLALPGIHRLMNTVEEEQSAKVETKKRRGDKVNGRLLYFEDDTLPGGGNEFYGTILAAWSMTVLVIEKFSSFIKRDKELNSKAQELCDTCIDFFAMVDREIVTNENELFSTTQKKRMLKKLPAKDLKHFHEELRKKGYKVG